MSTSTSFTLGGMRRQRPLADRVATVSALDDPVRLALLDLVARSEAALSRDQAAQALGVTRRTAAFHLDRLARRVCWRWSSGG